jgi:hypothetical protein
MKSRHFILIMLCTVPLSISMAQALPRDDMIAGISRCIIITDERTFLDCVYGAAQPVRAELGLPPAPILQQNLVPAATLFIPAPSPPAATLQPSMPSTNPAPSSPPDHGFFDWLWPF